MRGWSLAGWLLVLVLPVAAAGPWGSGTGPLAVTLRIVDGGSPFQGSLTTTERGADGHYETLEATLDSTGSGTLHLRPGQSEVYLVGPAPNDRPVAFGTLAIAQSMNLSLDLAARTATVPVDLTVVDGETGAPLSNAEILPQMLFGDYQCIGYRPTTAAPSVSGSPPRSQTPPEPCDLQWSEPGHLVGKVPPGVLDLRASVLDHSTCMVGFEQTDGTQCRIYAPTYRTFQAAAGQTVKATIALAVVPAPDAGIEGYLISNITGKAIPMKSIQFLGTGPFANVGFSAYLDRDGSYRLRIPAGNYTASTFVCGHDGLTVPFMVTSGRTLRLDLVLEAYGHTVVRPAGMGGTSTATGSTPTGDGGITTSSSTTASVGPGSANGSPPSYPSCDSMTTTINPGGASDGSPATEESRPTDPEPASAHDVGGFAVADFHGGLGPLGGIQYNDRTGAAHEDTTGSSSSAKGRFSPALPVTASLVLVALAALALRRRLD